MNNPKDEKGPPIEIAPQDQLQSAAIVSAHYLKEHARENQWRKAFEKEATLIGQGKNASGQQSAHKQEHQGQHQGQEQQNENLDQFIQGLQGRVDDLGKLQQPTSLATESNPLGAIERQEPMSKLSDIEKTQPFGVSRFMENHDAQTPEQEISLSTENEEVVIISDKAGDSTTLQKFPEKSTTETASYATFDEMNPPDVQLPEPQHPKPQQIDDAMSFLASSSQMPKSVNTPGTDAAAVLNCVIAKFVQESTYIQNTKTDLNEAQNQLEQKKKTTEEQEQKIAQLQQLVQHHDQRIRELLDENQGLRGDLRFYSQVEIQIRNNTDPKALKEEIRRGFLEKHNTIIDELEQRYKVREEELLAKMKQIHDEYDEELKKAEAQLKEAQMTTANNQELHRKTQEEMKSNEQHYNNILHTIDALLNIVLESKPGTNFFWFELTERAKNLLYFQGNIEKASKHETVYQNLNGEELDKAIAKAEVETKGNPQFIPRLLRQNPSSIAQRIPQLSERAQGALLFVEYLLTQLPDFHKLQEYLATYNVCKSRILMFQELQETQLAKPTLTTTNTQHLPEKTTEHPQTPPLPTKTTAHSQPPLLKI